LLKAALKSLLKWPLKTSLKPLLKSPLKAISEIAPAHAV